MSKPSLTLGTTLYHGTLSKLPNGFPNSKDGNWFATDATQSILHALASHKARQTHTPYLYIYKLINVPKITKFRDRNNLNAFASTLGFNTNYGSMAFTNANANLAREVCHYTKYDGWWFPSDQAQVMLCNPAKFLKFVKVLKINLPAKGYTKVRFNTTPLFSGWVKANANKFSTMPIRLNNIINNNQPSNNSIYVIPTFVHGNSPAYFSSHGKRLPNINYNKNKYIHKGRSLNTQSLHFKNTNSKTGTIMFDRIKAKTGHKYTNINASDVKEIRLT